MKGQDKIIETLNHLLADELTAISQYMVHSEMCSNWGYAKLHETFEKNARDEMDHAESLIGRIIFLEGKPIVSRLNPMKIGATVPEMVMFDTESEYSAVKAYNEAVRLCGDLDDQGTGDLLVGILKDEERHASWGEKQQTQIAQMSLPLYLSLQS